MKLVIQVPCYNEEKTLPQVIADLPLSIPGIDCIETQVIDDGSTDGTARAAASLGVAHIVSFKKNRGLAAAFKAGVDNALMNGADILVSTDGDNQYSGKDVVKLVQPIIEGVADIVIGCRPIDTHPEFSPLKKMLQKLGSRVLRVVSRTEVKDSASGFRAYSKIALLRMNIYSEFSYCLETLIQAGFGNLKIVSVDIGINPKTRESRLFKNVSQYVWRQTKTIVTVFLLYRANVFFNALALFVFALSLLLLALALALVFVYRVHVGLFGPLIVLGGVLFAVGVQIFFVGILASLISSVRKLSEDTNYRIKTMEIREKDTRRTG